MDNLNTISYADGWKEAYTPVYKREISEDIDEPVAIEKSKKQYGKPYLLIVQLIIALLFLLTAFGIKTFGGDFYNTVHNWYYENLNDEIIMTESFETFDLDSVFSNED